MRTQAYRLFEIVAWPATVWCGIELLLRASVADFAGAASTALIGAMAGLTIAGCRWRTALLPTRE